LLLETVLKLINLERKTHNYNEVVTMAEKLKITLKRSVIGRLENQKRTVRALGLRKIGSTVVQDDSDVIKGMINTVKHLVEVKTVSGE